MTLFYHCLYLFYSFLKIGFLSFGGGYAILSMIMIESEKLSITLEQFADLNVLDMIVPGPIAINSATFVGYLNSGFWGALASTAGVSVPSFVIVTLFMYFTKKFKGNQFLEGFLKGVKPAAVGLIYAAALMLSGEVLLNSDKNVYSLFTQPLSTVSWTMAAVYIITAVLNIRYKINPILLTVFAGIFGAIFIR